MNKREFTNSMLGGYDRLEPTTDASRGYINGYRYGVEYQTNHEKPDLPDDVIVCINNEPDTSYADRVCEWRWCVIRSFRITDERYKPSDTSYLVERGMELVNQIQEKLESVAEKLEANSWWDYENDKPLSFPPAGIRCLVSSPDYTSEWIETFVVGMGEDGSCVFDLMTSARYDYAYDGWSVPERFRPLDYFTRKEAQAEKKRVVDAAAEKFHASIMPDYSGQPFLDGLGALCDAGYLKLPDVKEE